MLITLRVSSRQDVISASIRVVAQLLDNQLAGVAPKASAVISLTSLLNTTPPTCEFKRCIVEAGLVIDGC